MASDGVVWSDTWRRLMCRGLKDLRDDGHLCDTRIFAAGDVQLNAHAVVLSASSPYFRSLFSSVKQGFFTVRIDHVASDVLVNVLHFIYTGELRTGTCAVSDMASVARQLELRKLESLCTEFQKTRNEKPLHQYRSNDNAATADIGNRFDSLTGNWTSVTNGNRNREFKSPQGSSRTSTPVTPASRTPTPKTNANVGSNWIPAPTIHRSTVNAAASNNNNNNNNNNYNNYSSTHNTGSAISPRQSEPSRSTAAPAGLFNLTTFNSNNSDSNAVHLNRRLPSNAFSSSARPQGQSQGHAAPAPRLRMQNQYDGKVRPFTCHICGRKYGSSKGVNWHMQAHHGVSASRRLVSASSLSSANGTGVNNDKKAQCKICGRFFPQLNYLHLHEKCHRNNAGDLAKKSSHYTSPLASIGYQRRKPDESGRYVCRICGRAFLRSQALGSHMWCHLPQGRHGKRQLNRTSDPCDAFSTLPRGTDAAGDGDDVELLSVEEDGRRSHDLTRPVAAGGDQARGSSVERLSIAKNIESMHQNTSDSGITSAALSEDSPSPAGDRPPSHDIQQQRQQLRHSNAVVSGNQLEEQHTEPLPTPAVVDREDNDVPTSLTVTTNDFTSVTRPAQSMRQQQQQQRRKSKLFGCEFCGREFLYLTSLRSHRRLHTSDKPHTCKACGKSFKWFSVFTRHECVTAAAAAAATPASTPLAAASMDQTQSTKVKVKSEPVECVTENLDNLKRIASNSNKTNEHSKVSIKRDTLDGGPSHMRESSADRNRGNGLLASSKLGRDGNNRSLSRKHRLGEQQDLPRSAAASSSSSGLPQPVPVGSGDKWSCPLCGNIYKSLYFVKNHMRIVHAGLKRYSCPLCDKRFGYSNVLRDHMKLHEMHGVVLPPQHAMMSSTIAPPPPLTHNPLPSSSSLTHNPLQPPSAITHNSLHDWLPPVSSGARGGLLSLQHQTWSGAPHPPPPPRWVTPPGFPSVLSPSGPPPPLWPNLASPWPPEHPPWGRHTHSHPPTWPPPTGVLRHPPPPSWLGKDIPPMPGISGSSAANGLMFRDSLAGRGLFPCRGCSEIFDSQALLVAHAELRHKSPPTTDDDVASVAADQTFFSCGVDDCPEVLDSREELHTHRQQVHSTGDKKSYACTYCSRVLYSYGGWKLHEMIHRGEKPLKCKHCPYNARSSANLFSHMQSRHKHRALPPSSATVNLAANS